ncbi:MAG: hypothetical protein AAEJ43_12470 [Gammaproteobacteria bacterium]
MAAAGNSLPTYVDRKFDEYLRCGRLDILARVPLSVFKDCALNTVQRMDARPRQRRSWARPARD